MNTKTGRIHALSAPRQQAISYQVTLACAFFHVIQLIAVADAAEERGAATKRPFDDKTTSAITGNPYAGVDWDRVYRLEGDLHMHSEARGTTLEEYVEAAEEKGFGFLMVTRRASGNYKRWEDHGVDPGKYNIIPVYGRESRPGAHHVLQVFSTDVANHSTPEDVFQAVAAEEGAIAIVPHPNDVQRRGMHREIDWWIGIFEKYDSLLGIEVANYLDQGHGQRRRRQDQFVVASDIWHKLLKHFGFEKKIWGFGASDGHYPWQLGYASTILLAEERTLEGLRKAVMEGRIFWQVNKDGKAPRIGRIDVSGATISVKTENQAHTVWIYDNEIVKTGDTFASTDWGDGQKYVTFEVWSGKERNVERNDVVGSQPFYR